MMCIGCWSGGGKLERLSLDHFLMWIPNMVAALSGWRCAWSVLAAKLDGAMMLDFS